MSFYVYSTRNATGDALLFCFDTPPHFETQLVELLNTTRSDPPREPLAFLQSTVVGVVVEMYNSSVWRARHHIRKIEKVNVVITIAAWREYHWLIGTLTVSRKGPARTIRWIPTSSSSMKWRGTLSISVRYLKSLSIPSMNSSMAPGQFLAPFASAPVLALAMGPNQIVLTMKCVSGSECCETLAVGLTR
jgi:hypothetical protein